MNARRGGRPAVISRESVIRAGVEVGLRDLTLKAVAERLDVGSPALYHHVDNLHALTVAVGDEIVGSLALPTDATGPADYLIGLAHALLDLERRHPGIGAFCAAAHAEATITRWKIAAAAAGLSTHRVEPVDATMLTSIVANLAFSFASRERTEALPTTHADALFGWIIRNTVEALLADRASAPWRAV